VVDRVVCKPTTRGKHLSNLNAVQKVYDAFAKGDIPTVLGSLSADIAWTEAEGFPYGGTYHGPKAILEGVFMRLGSEWEGFAAVPDEFVDGGDTVVALGKYSGTYKRTGKSFQANFAHVWKMSDGKAIRFVQYVDTLVVQRALQA
jgi:ketosteroid isomerase-like protein